MDRTTLVTSAAALTLSTLTTVALTSAAPATAAERAQAILQGCTDSSISGFATLTEIPSDQGVKEVDIYLQIEGIAPGPHGVHIHETASCTPCGSAGGHFDPGPEGFTSPDGNHPYHSGDLVNIDVHRNGVGVLTSTTSRVTLGDGVLSLFDNDGSAFIVHVNEDTFCPDGVVAGCAGGGRVACAIIEPAAIDESIQIAVSKRPYRNPAEPLNRNTIKGGVYIFVSPQKPRTAVDRVEFFLDGQFVKTEHHAPFDLKGTFDSYAARLDTRTLEDGQHSVAAVLRLSNGHNEYRAATFRVSNRTNLNNGHSHRH